MSNPFSSPIALSSLDGSNGVGVVGSDTCIALPNGTTVILSGFTTAPNASGFEFVA